MNGFEAGQAQPRRDRRDRARRFSGDGRGDRADVVGRGAAAAADNVDEARVGELADQRRHGFRALVVAAEFVRQPGIGIGADERIGDAPEFGDVSPHLPRAERAIESDRKRRRVGDRIPERFRRLPGENAAGTVGDGAGNHHRHADAARLAHLGDGVDRGLGVERVEHRLDQERVDAAVDQPVHLFGVGDAQLVEGDGAEARIGNVRRHRGGAVGRADGAGDEARPPILAFGDARGLAGEPRARGVELVSKLRHAVIGLRDAGR